MSLPDRRDSRQSRSRSRPFRRALLPLDLLSVAILHQSPIRPNLGEVFISPLRARRDAVERRWATFEEFTRACLYTIVAPDADAAESEELRGAPNSLSHRSDSSELYKTPGSRPG